MYIDSFFYGKTVIAPLGIVLYNVFGKGGPSLYGKVSIDGWHCVQSKSAMICVS